MKKIHTLLEKGNLTARERFLLLIQNDIHRMKTDKEILSEADKAALENWRAENNEEAREWNNLNEGWKYSGRMGIEAELYYCEAQVAHMRVRPLIMELIKFPIHRDMKRMIEGIKELKKVNSAEALEIIEKQRKVKLEEGMDFEYAVYELAFELLDKRDQDRLVELYPDIKTEQDYLNEEEMIANLLEGKSELSPEAKEKLGKLIATRAYNNFAKEYQLFHYFACFPLAKVARHFLEKRGVKITESKKKKKDDDELSSEAVQRAVEKYAEKHNKKIEEILKTGFIEWYDDEGFAHMPLAVVEQLLLNRWLQSKIKARKELKELVDKGALKLGNQLPRTTGHERFRGKDIYPEELMKARKALEIRGEKGLEIHDDKIITGESLYALKTDWEFVEDFKERTDEYDPDLGLVYADDDPEHQGEHLDRELLVCRTISDGKEPVWFSRYGMFTRRLEGLIESTVFFKEEVENGKTSLKFKNKEIEKTFIIARDEFIAAYQRLLAVHEVMKKLVPIYEAELDFRTRDLLTQLDGYIEAHNEALRAAEESLDYKSGMFGEKKRVSRINSKFYIDPKKIKADQEIIEKHSAELRIFFRDFGSTR